MNIKVPKVSLTYSLAPNFKPSIGADLIIVLEINVNRFCSLSTVSNKTTFKNIFSALTHCYIIILCTYEISVVMLKD